MRFLGSHIVSTMLAGRRSGGSNGVAMSSRCSTSSASAEASKDTAVRSAAEERLAQRMCPHRTSPVISSILADSPTSLNGCSLPEKS